MLTVSEAVAAVLARAVPLPAERVPLRWCGGVGLAEAVLAPADSPPFAKSSVDGFALRAADAVPEARLIVMGEAAAGHAFARGVGPGEAIAIMTGAPIPAGSDAVLMRERVQIEPDGSIRVAGGAKSGQNIIAQGAEARQGAEVLPKGMRVGPIQRGVLAGLGAVDVLGHARPRVAIVPTGDELVPPDREPGPGQIRNSNGTMLAGLVAACHALPRELPIARDQKADLREKFEEGLKDDVLLISGGVSAGAYDLVPSVLVELGVEQVFHKVKVKPGKPLWFGVGPARGDKPGALVFGLPGNPVSGLVSLLLFVKPALDALAGLGHHPPRLGSAKLASAFEHKGDRPTFHPGRWSNPERTEAVALVWAGSADLVALAGADGFLSFPEGDRRHAEGARLPWLPIP